MEHHVSAVEHLTRRLSVVIPGTYDEVRARYERLVPIVDYAAFAAAHTWDEAVMAAEDSAPYGFMRYYRGDIAAALADSPSSGRATEYLMGNHVIAERMFRHDPAVMLHAPLRTLIHIDRAGDTRFVVDQPSLLFASYGRAEITAVGQYLDDLLARLIGLLGAEVPAALRSSHGERRAS
jgi:hypothetical protein